MILRLYGFKNRLTGMFERPSGEQVIEQKDYIDFLVQSISQSDSATIKRYSEYDVYDLGTFDTKSGEIISCCDFVASLEPVLLSLLASKDKGVINGNREEKVD